jgi:hypothetical protein
MFGAQQTTGVQLERFEQGHLRTVVANDNGLASVRVLLPAATGSQIHQARRSAWQTGVHGSDKRRG